MESKLSKLDLQALRQADRVIFSYHRGESRIRCVKELDRKGPFADREREYVIDVESRVTDYAREYASVGAESNGYSCHSLVYGYKLQPCEWTTTAAMLRIGDELQLRWCAANNSQNITDGGLYRDELQLLVRRGKRELLFHVDSSLCPDNTARMIKH